MDVLLYAFFMMIGLVTLVGRSKSFGNIGRLIPFIGMLFSLLWIASYYQDGTGLSFASIGSSYIIPLYPGNLFIICIIFIDGFASLGP